MQGLLASHELLCGCIGTEHQSAVHAAWLDRAVMPNLQHTPQWSAVVHSIIHMTEKLCAKKNRTLCDNIMPELCLPADKMVLAAMRDSGDIKELSSLTSSRFRNEAHEVHVGNGNLACSCCAMELCLTVVKVRENGLTESFLWLVDSSVMLDEALIAQHAHAQVHP